METSVDRKQIRTAANQIQTCCYQVIYSFPIVFTSKNVIRKPAVEPQAQVMGKIKPLQRQYFDL